MLYITMFFLWAAYALWFHQHGSNQTISAWAIKKIPQLFKLSVSQWKVYDSSRLEGAFKKVTCSTNRNFPCRLFRPVNLKQIMSCESPLLCVVPVGEVTGYAALLTLEASSGSPLSGLQSKLCFRNVTMVPITLESHFREECANRKVHLCSPGLWKGKSSSPKHFLHDILWPKYIACSNPNDISALVRKNQSLKFSDNCLEMTHWTQWHCKWHCKVSKMM